MTDRDQPEVMRKDCDCVLNVWPDSIRTDFCEEHAKTKIIDAEPSEKP